MSVAASNPSDKSAAPALPEPHANAHLVAAARDMLQALREVEGDCFHLENPGDTVAICNFCAVSEGDPHEPECTMQFVLAAIAKAEGRS